MALLVHGGGQQRGQAHDVGVILVDGFDELLGGHVGARSMTFRLTLFIIRRPGSCRCRGGPLHGGDHGGADGGVAAGVARGWMTSTPVFIAFAERRTLGTKIWPLAKRSPISLMPGIRPSFRMEGGVDFLVDGLGHLGLGSHDVALDDKLGDFVQNGRSFPLLLK